MVAMTDSIDIPVPDIFDFDRNLVFLNRNEDECMHEVIERSLIKPIEVGSMRSLVKISAPHDTALRLTILAGSMPESKDDQELLITYIKNLFDLNTDLQPFYKMAKQDPLLKDLVEEYDGLRIVQIPDLFEALCWGVFGQQINLRFAYQLKRQFVEKYGESLVYQGKTYWFFPHYEKIASLSVEELSEIKMTRRKSEYMIGIAQLMTSGELSKDKLLQLGDPAIIEKDLVTIRGIGPWTANYLLMRCLGFTSAFPIDDVG